MAKRGHDIGARIIGFLVSLGLAGAIVLESPKVQSSLSRKLLDRVNSALTADITFSSIHVEPFNTVVIKDFLVLDREPYTEDRYNRGWEPIDTILYARSVEATLSLKGLLGGEGVHLGRARIDGLLFQLASEPGEKYNDNISRFFKAKPGPEVPQPGPDIFDIRRVEINGLRYRMVNFHRQAYEPRHGFNWDDLDVRAVKARGHNIKFAGGRMSFHLDQLTGVTDKCGYKATSISGHGKVGLGKTEIYGFHLKDPWSDIRFREYTMLYCNSRAFQEYVDKVRMGVDVIENGRLGAQTVSYFSGIMVHSDFALDISRLHAEGYVNDLNVSTLKCTEVNTGIKANMSARITDVTHAEGLSINAEVKSLNLTTKQASELLGRISPDVRVDLSRFAPGTTLNVTAKAIGPLNKLKADCRINSSIGSATANVMLRNLADPDHDIEIEGTAGSRELDLGWLLGSKQVGKCTMNTGARAILKKTGPSIILDSLDVASIEALGYRYSGLFAAGRYNSDGFDGRILSDDPNLTFTLSGSAGIVPDSNGAIFCRIKGDIPNADLEAINIDKRGGRSKASMKIDADFSGYMTGAIDGSIIIDSLRLEDDYERHEFNRIEALSSTKGDSYSINLEAPFISGSYSGSEPVANMVSDLMRSTAHKHLSALFQGSAPQSNAPEKVLTKGLLSLDFHDSRSLLAYIAPGIYIADSTHVEVNLSGEEVNASIQSPRLAMGKTYIKGARINVDNQDCSLNAEITGSEINAGGFRISDGAVTAFAKDNSATVGLHFTNANDEDDFGEIYLESDLSRTEGDTLVVNARTLPSYIRIHESEWTIAPSEVDLRPGDIQVKGFMMKNGGQGISIDGGLCTERADTIMVRLDSLALSNLDYFLEIPLGLKGRLDGTASILSPTAEGIQPVANLLLSSISVGDVPMGDIHATGAWNDALQRAEAHLSNMVDGNQALKAHCYFTPSDKSISLEAAMNGFSLAPVSSIMPDIFNVSGGHVSGKIRMDGSADDPELSSEGLIFNDAILGIAFTNVPYTLNGPFHLTDDGLTFDNVDIHGSTGGHGTLSGGLEFDRLRDLRVNARLVASELEALNIPEEGNQGIYGQLHADADISVSGPFDDLTITGTVATVGPGSVNVPIGSAVASNSSDLLTFRQREIETDPYEQMLQARPKENRRKGNMHLHVTATANPQTEAHVEIDKASGNVVTALGSGTVELDMHTAEHLMSLAGDYTLTGGKYHFELPGVIGKDFNVVNGSTIKFAGDIMDTEIDLSAVYNVKASLNTLIADTSAVSTRRPVECLINAGGTLRNLQVGFGINVPDLDPITKSQVESALNTDDKIQQQFVSLLVMGTFLPSEQSGVFNSTNILYSNVSEIMSNQLNNILQRLEIPLDLGLGYQQNDGGTDIFDVAVSTQLFNNRVLVNGSVGNRKYSTSTATNGDVVGDLDIEVKLDRPGQFRLKLFSHSADEFTSFLDYSQRNGVGVTYQKEFTRFRDFLRDIFTSKKKRGQRAEDAEMESRETITFQIDE